MNQHDMIIDNGSGSTVRSDLNNALAALVTQNSGSSAPSTTYAGMVWFDTSNNLVKMRSEDDANWVTLGSLVGITWTPYSGGSAVNTPALVGENVLAPHEGLVVKQVTSATVDIDATAVQVKNDSGVAVRLTSVNLTVNITNSGANGLDTGSEANSTWYHVWVIYNGTTTAGLLSTSATSPTLSSGYTHKGYVGRSITTAAAICWRLSSAALSSGCRIPERC